MYTAINRNINSYCISLTLFKKYPVVPIQFILLYIVLIDTLFFLAIPITVNLHFNKRQIIIFYILIFKLIGIIQLIIVHIKFNMLQDVQK